MIGYPFSRDFLPLGFGCAWLSSGRRTNCSLRLVETAYDAGIRYFDVARMYMSGEAEGVLGKFLPKRRDEVIVTSKAGIMPLSGGGMRRWLRRADKVANVVFGTPLSHKDNYHFGVFDTDSLRKSVETSLTELRTDHLDALLLHEVDENDLADGSVMTLLEKLRTEGKINSYGFASTRAQTERLITQYSKKVSILQTASTVLDNGRKPLENQGSFLIITHSVLSEALEKIVTRLSMDIIYRKQWMNLTGIDPNSRERIAELMLAEALEANSGGVVLFSSSSPARIITAARVARERFHTAEQIIGLRKFAAQMKISDVT